MSWKNNLLVIMGAVVSMVAIDQLLSLRYTPRDLREVREGIVELKNSTPNILAISSSHGRSFHVLGEVLRKKTDAGVHLTAIPLESGRIKAMNWVLQNRARSLIEDAEGKVQSPLTHLLFGITWWDTCRRQPAPTFDQNVISRAWRWRDYLGDLARHGVTSDNRNFLSYRSRKNLQDYFSMLSAREETHSLYGGVGGFARSLVTGQAPVRNEAEESVFMQRWQVEIETGSECYLAASEMAALDQFVEYAKSHDLDLTIVLFPLMPDTITSVAQVDTITPFANRLLEYGKERGIRVVDMTSVPAIGPDDFMQDYDHLNQVGNEKFANYALTHKLHFLQEIPAAALARRQVQEQ